MRLKSLELVGFKSFVDRTIVHFEAGITGIVGPNGCGKSNIVDAIRWVMGEQSAKHLRGGAMEDVIFSGSTARDPMGMAQVFLTFDNSDGRAPIEYAQYSEIQIGRRLYRSGESEYYINKTPCRLRDIIDLFLGTGVGTKAYSIVEQGMVGQIISSKPEERRLFIEEVAGISKFKARKEAALRKIESTKTNLSRLNDILAELTRQLNSLNRQAKKAERYQRLSEELRGIELQVAATRYHFEQEKLAQFENQNNSLSQLEVSSASELSTYENSIEAERVALAELEQEFDGVQQKLYEMQSRVKLAEASIEHKTTEIESTSQQNTIAAQEMEEMTQRLQGLAGQLEQIRTAKAGADEKVASSAEALNAFEQELSKLKQQKQNAEQEHNKKREQIYSVASELAKLNTRLENADRREIDIQGRIAKNQTQIDAIDGRKNKMTEDTSVRQNELTAASQLKFKLSEDSDSLAQTLSEQRQAWNNAETQVRELHDRLQEKRSRYNSLQEVHQNLEGYHEGVRSILKQSQDSEATLHGIMGTVAEIIDTEPEYESAVSAVLGEKLQYVVVQSQSSGVEAVEYLKTVSTGRGTFVPLSLREQEMGARSQVAGEGVIGPLVNYVRFSDDHRRLGQYLLGDVVLVDSLTRALGLWQGDAGKNTFVTMSGEVLDASGAVSGGKTTDNAAVILAQKRKIADLEREISEIQSELTSAKGAAMRHQEHVKSMEAQLEKTKRDAHNEELRLVTLKRDVEQLAGEAARFEQERDRLAVEIAALAGEQQELEQEREVLRAHIAEQGAQKALWEIDLNSAQNSFDQVNQELSNQEQRYIQLKVELAQARERQATVDREIEQTQATERELNTGIERRRSKISEGNNQVLQLKADVTRLGAELTEAVSAAAELEEKRNTLKAGYESKQQALRDVELSLRDVRKQHGDAMQAAHEIQLRITQQRSKLEHLIDSVRERYRLTLNEVYQEHARLDAEFNLEEQSALVEDLKQKIDGIGPVNIDAVREYEELSQRFNFLNQQHQDLTNSLDALVKAIQKINRTSKERFGNAYEAVNAQFQELFPRLFRGGKAKLVLTDPENLLESGVEIVASPPGKKLQSVTLLSGGEKALTAIALIFSIFLIKPSPFCLLDEVDAPLDDANIDRFNEMIRSMMKYSQFILITHNKRTMEMADTLYGVTMEEPGASKMVSVRLNMEKVEEAEVA